MNIILNWKALLGSTLLNTIIAMGWAISLGEYWLAFAICAAVWGGMSAMVQKQPETAEFDTLNSRTCD